MESNHPFYEEVRRYVHRLVRDAQSARDVAQDVFLRRLSTKTPVKNEKSWLYRTARNLVIDHYRRSGRIRFEDGVELLPEEATYFNPVHAVQQKEQIEMLNEKLNELSPRHREVLRLKFQQGLKYAEIAEVLNEPTTTVAWLIHEAIQLLRREMMKSE